LKFSGLPAPTMAFPCYAREHTFTTFTTRRLHLPLSSSMLKPPVAGALPCRGIFSLPSWLFSVFCLPTITEAYIGRAWAGMPRGRRSYACMRTLLNITCGWYILDTRIPPASTWQQSCLSLYRRLCDVNTKNKGLRSSCGGRGRDVARRALLVLPTHTATCPIPVQPPPPPHACLLLCLPPLLPLLPLPPLTCLSLANSIASFSGVIWILQPFHHPSYSYPSPYCTEPTFTASDNGVQEAGAALAGKRLTGTIPVDVFHRGWRGNRTATARSVRHAAAAKELYRRW